MNGNVDDLRQEWLTPNSWEEGEGEKEEEETNTN